MGHIEDTGAKPGIQKDNEREIQMFRICLIAATAMTLNAAVAPAWATGDKDKIVITVSDDKLIGDDVGALGFNGGMPKGGKN